jgi:hypothetical protein
VFRTIKVDNSPQIRVVEAKVAIATQAVILMATRVRATKFLEWAVILIPRVRVRTLEVTNTNSKTAQTLLIHLNLSTSHSLKFGRHNMNVAIQMIFNRS